MIFGAIANARASRRQAELAREGLDLQRDIHEDNIERQQPFIDQGYQAARLEADLLGLGGGGGGLRYGNVGNNAFAFGGFNPQGSTYLQSGEPAFQFIGQPGGPQSRGPILGQQLGYFGVQPQRPTAADRQDSAYDTFLNSGFARSALETTQRDFDDITGAYGAAGGVLSGSAVGALNDRNRRNTSNAFNNYFSAVNQNATRGANTAAGVGSQAAQFGRDASQSLNNIGQAQANRANALGGLGDSLLSGAARAVGGFF